MIKNIILPVQAWLLSQKRCVGCGKSLTYGIKKKVKGKEIISCSCGRMYTIDPKTKKYRRAKFNEV